MSNEKATLLRATLVVGASRMGSFWEGWAPSYSFTLAGPVPSASELVAEFRKPDGSDWLSVSSSVDECGPDDLVRVRETVTDESLQTTDTGEFPFRFRLVSELEGVDETLFEGHVRVDETAPGSKDFLARHDGLLRVGSLWLDVHGDADAPRLTASVHMSGEVETYQLGAYLFRDGKKVFSSEQDQAEVSTGTSYLPSSGSSGGQAVTEVIVQLTLCKGYRNCDYANMEDWLDLSKSPGRYEIKLTRQKKLDRVLDFTVGTDGLIYSTGVVERTTNGHRMLAPVKVSSKLDAPSDEGIAPFYGNPDPTDGPGVEAFYTSRSVPEAEGEDAGTGLDAESQQALDNGLGKATNTYRWYWDDMEKGGEGYDFLQQCEVAIIYSDEVAKVLGDLDDDLSVDFLDDRTTLGDVKQRIATIRDRAQGYIDRSKQAASDVLTPYREVLRNDKLSIFDEHPAPDYRYYTSGKKVIETPEELAEAACWYFEGTENQGYLNEKWTVRGWRFDDDHTIVEEIDRSDHGTNAPRSAFP